MHVVLGMLKEAEETEEERSGPEIGLISDTCVVREQRSYPEKVPEKRKPRGLCFLCFFFCLKDALRITPGLGCPKSPPPLTYQNSEVEAHQWCPLSLFLVLILFAFPQSFDPVLSTRCGFQCTASWLPYSLPPYLLPLCCFSGSCSPALNNPEVLAQPPNNPLFLGSQVSSTHEIPSWSHQSLAGSPPDLDAEFSYLIKCSLCLTSLLCVRFCVISTLLYILK